MSLDIEFAFVCQKRFSELSGEGDRKRFCHTCELEVINLDPLDHDARLQVFAEAKERGIVPCIAVTTQIPGSRPCEPPQLPLALPHLVGTPQFVP